MKAGAVLLFALALVPLSGCITEDPNDHPCPWPQVMDGQRAVRVAVQQTEEVRTYDQMAPYDAGHVTADLPSTARGPRATLSASGCAILRLPGYVESIQVYAYVPHISDPMCTFFGSAKVTFTNDTAEATTTLHHLCS